MSRKKWSLCDDCINNMNSYCNCDNPNWEYDYVHECDDYDEDDCNDCMDDNGYMCDEDCGCDDGADCFYDD